MAEVLRMTSLALHLALASAHTLNRMRTINLACTMRITPDSAYIEV